MRLIGTTVPYLSGFQRLDTRVTDQNQFINARDLQIRMANHNTLLKNRARKVLFAIRGNTSDDVLIAGSATGYIEASSTGYANTGDGVGECVLSVPIKIVKNITREVVITLRGYVDNDPVTIYPVISDAHSRVQVNSAVYVAVSAGSETFYTVTAPVPAAVRTSGRGVLTLIASGGLTGTTVLGPSAILDAGVNYVDGALNPTVGDAVVFADTSVAPVRIASVETITAGSRYRAFVERRLNKIPSFGTNYTTQALNKAFLASICAYEEYVSDLHALAGTSTL